MSCTNKRHILEIDELSVSFRQYESDKSSRQVDLPVISKLSVSVHEGEIVAVVGSSGSGKSLLAHAILGLLPYNAKVTGEMYYDGELLTEKKIRELRGNKIAFVPQSTTYLDPLMNVGAQVSGSKDEKKREKQKRLFRRYGLGEEVEKKYPFECSGGMTRRVLLTTALMGDPELIIADEPTPGMDLALAKRSMEDFRKFADEGKGVLLITHDIELALEVADRIAVFYAGTTVEIAAAKDFLEGVDALRHPYSKALWKALPQNGFEPIPGFQPYAKYLPKGCLFSPRCPHKTKECEENIPMREVRGGYVRCIHAD